MRKLQELFTKDVIHTLGKWLLEFAQKALPVLTYTPTALWWQTMRPTHPLPVLTHTDIYTAKAPPTFSETVLR